MTKPPCYIQTNSHHGELISKVYYALKEVGTRVLR